VFHRSLLWAWLTCGLSGGRNKLQLQGRVAEWQKAAPNNRTSEKTDVGAFGCTEQDMPVAELTRLGMKLLGTLDWD
jgi:hypothetical protein